jgi:hypothetical protein
MHYEVYKACCEADGIQMHDWAMPRALFKEKEESKRSDGDTLKQRNLDGKFEPSPGLKAFMQEGILEAVARHIVCNDQV